MIILRGYKSVVFWLIFVSLWIIGCDTCCKEEEGDETEKKGNTNVDNNLNISNEPKKEDFEQLNNKLNNTENELEQKKEEIEQLKNKLDFN